MNESSTTADTGRAVLPSEFTIHVRFITDWHVGSGLGRPGDVDRLAVRDEDDLPFLPAKTLTGILRDAAERVALGLDGADANADAQASSHTWYDWVRYLFGDQPSRSDVAGEADLERVDKTPRGAAVSIRPARLSAALRDCLRPMGDDRDRRRPLRDALTIIKPGVTIDRDSGAAMDKNLRFEEMVRCGITLTATARLSEAAARDPATHQTVTALLVAAAKLAERLGGKRRRGAGRVEITIPSGPSAAEVADWFQQQPQAPPPATPAADAGSSRAKNADFSQANDHTGGRNADPWTTLNLRVTARSPLLVASRTVGNVVEGLDFIPGTYFLPLIHQALAKLGADAAAAIQNGQARIAPATIEIDGQRALPLPAALHRPKVGGGFDEVGGVANRLRETEADAPEHVKGIAKGYVGPIVAGQQLPKSNQPKQILRMHNTVLDRLQRPAAEVGGVFTYQAIEAGTILRTELRLRQSLLDQNGWQQLKDYLSKARYSIGRSKKDDYGSVRLEALDVAEPDTGKSRFQSSQRFTVWLTSDALLAGPSLNAATTIDTLQAELESRLNCKLTIARCGGRPNVYLRSGRCESWQTQWNLPRPSLISIAAGSCVEFEVSGGPLAADALWDLEQDGIGQRRAEGFGMLRVNDPLLAAETRKWKPAPPPDDSTAVDKSTSPIAASHADHPLARQLEKETWRRLIFRVAEEQSLNPDFRKYALGIDGQLPTSNQAAAVRNAVKRLRSANDVAPLEKWLGHLAKLREQRWPTNALRCIEHKKDKDPIAGGKIVELLHKNHQVWHILSNRWQEDAAANAADDWPVLTADGAEALKAELWTEAVRTIIDAILRVHQRELQNPQRKETNHG